MMTTRTLPRALYRAEQVRALDACAIDTFGIPATTLMERAGQAAFGVIQRRWPRAQRIAVYCGGGNNGGDGYVIAALLRRAGKDVTLVHIGSREKLTGGAKTAMQQAVAAQVTMLDALDPAVRLDFSVDLVVDALLGIGLRGQVRADYLGPIEAINASGVPVLSVDIPSGLSADTGTQFGPAVRAQATITFIGLKQGLFSGRAPALCGDIYFDALMVPSEVYAKVPMSAERIDASLAKEFLAPRERDTHKGRYGHVLVIGGERGFAGAALLAAESAARCGAGLVSVATRPEHSASFVARCPEIMAHGIGHPTGIEPLLAKATVVIVGPGLGQSPWASGLLERVLETQLPLVIDADALNLVASRPDGVALLKARMENAAKEMPVANHVLTPHPGEASRLLGVDVASVQADRFASARELQARCGGTVLLKGAGTVIDSGEGRVVSVATVGNPGMASGGMGDVLSGVIASLIAQGIAVPDAARLGAVLHGTAGDRAAAAQGERGLLASDLFPHLRELVNGLDVRRAPHA